MAKAKLRAKAATGLKVKAVIKLNGWEILSRAVEQGLMWGWNRAHKHEDNPSEDAIKQAMHDAIMSEIGEVTTHDG